MLLLAALVATAAWSDGFAQEIPLQTPVSITKSQGSTRLLCHFKHVSEDFDNTIIHWYQQKENKAPEWMFYISTGTTKADKSFQGHKYAVERVSDQKICTLIIKSIVPDDTATYYCAYWEPHYGRNPAITSTNTCTCREVPTGPRRPQAPQELEPRRGAAIGCWVPEPLLSAPQVPDPSLPVAGDGRTLPGPVHGGRLDVVPRACCRCRCRCFWLPLPFAAMELRKASGSQNLPCAEWRTALRGSSAISQGQTLRMPTFTGTSRNPGKPRSTFCTWRQGRLFSTTSPTVKLLGPRRRRRSPPVLSQ
ncbi:uncharacterized protein [Anser cygnoides]|uniref:uncharacterized protein isoform X1 n=1 Tax=Anser cygnoides TaxID=8845 RepID=UPI0034D2A905